jgi:Xaa-Pro aminopeptidase
MAAYGEIRARPPGFTAPDRDCDPGYKLRSIRYSPFGAMLTMHPTLLIGPSDWQPQRLPREEFARRIAALWRCDPQAERAIVYGTSHRHAELAYFTNLVPKLEAAAALLSRICEHRLFVGGGPNMLDAARPLTFIAQLSPLRELIDVIRRGGSLRRTLIVGADTMPTAFRRNLMEAAGSGEAVVDATEPVWNAMRRKSPAELNAIRAATAVIDTARGVMLTTLKSGASVSEVISGGELAANAAGAQDVRTLFSLDGGRTLRPFVGRTRERPDPLLLYVAVRKFNYWADRFLELSFQPEPSPLQEKAQAVLRSVFGAIRAGTPAREIEALIANSLAPYRPHPLTAHAFAQRIGLALHEPPATDLGAAFEEAEVYSIRIGATDGDRQHGVCSQMLNVGSDGIGFA